MLTFERSTQSLGHPERLTCETMFDCAIDVRKTPAYTQASQLLKCTFTAFFIMHGYKSVELKSVKIKAESFNDISAIHSILLEYYSKGSVRR